MTERLIFIYGTPQDGAIVAGGSQFANISLLDYDTRRGLSSLEIGAKLAVKTNTMSILQALNIQRGNCSISTTTASKTVTATASELGNGLFKLTGTAGTAFERSDVGLGLMVGGAIFPIVGFYETGSYNAVYVKFHSAQGTFAMPVGSLSVTVTTALFQATDNRIEGNVTDSADYDDLIVPVLSGGMDAAVTAIRGSSPEDTESRKIVDFSASYQIPASEVRTDDASRLHVRTSQISRVISQSGLQQVSFQAEVTAGNVSGTATLFPAILDSFWVNWTGIILEELSTGAEWDPSPRIDNFDESGRVGTVTQTFSELNFNETAAALNDPRIKGAQVRFTRSALNVHGIRGARAPFQVEVAYSSYIQATGASAVPYQQITQLYGSVIKPYLLAQARAIFGGTAVIYQETGPGIDPNTSTLQVGLTLFIVGSSSNVFSYSRTTRMQSNFNEQFDQIHDGEPHTYIGYTPGSALTGQVVIAVTSIDDQSLYGRPGAIAGRQFGGTQFGGALTISLPTAGIFSLNGSAGDSSASDDSFEFYPDPGDPRRLFPGFEATGQWRPLSQQAQETPQFWGEDIDAEGSQIKLVGAVYVGSYLYVKSVDSQVPAPAIGSRPKIPRSQSGDGSSGNSGSQTQGQETFTGE